MGTDSKPATKPRSRSRSRLRRAILWLVSLRGSPRAIGLGAASGMFVAFTPTYGVQLFLAPLVATLIGGNRPASLGPVWITNPVTLPPCYAFTYWVGTMFWSGPPVSEVYQMLVKTVGQLTTLDFWKIMDQFTLFFRMLGEIMIPLIIGGVLVGLMFGALTYVMTVEMIRRWRDYRLARRHRRRAARAAAG